MPLIRFPFAAVLAVICGGTAALAQTPPEAPPAPNTAIIYTNIYGPLITDWGYDVKQSTVDPIVGSKAQELFDPRWNHAQKIFGEDGFTVLRVAIYGDSMLASDCDPNTCGAHPNEGEVVRAVYADQLKAMKAAKDAATAAGRQVKFYADKKLFAKIINNEDRFQTNSFPEWTKNVQLTLPDGSTFNVLNPKKYGRMIADYLTFMKAEGYDIDILGLTCEPENTNDGLWTALQHRETVDEIKSLSLGGTAFKVPTFVGANNINIGTGQDNHGNSFATTFNSDLDDNWWSDRMEMTGTHYAADNVPSTTPSWRPRSHLVGLSKAAARGARTLWNTEIHYETSYGFIDNAEQSLNSFFHSTDLDVNTTGFVWWAYERAVEHTNGAANRQGQIKHALTTSTLGARRLEMNDEDGPGDEEPGQLVTRAFRKGNVITAWVVNNQDTAHTDFEFKLAGGRAISGNVTYTRWNETTTTPGSITPTSVTQFKLTIPARTVTLFRFSLLAGGSANSSPAFYGSSDDIIVMPEIPYGTAISGSLANHGGDADGDSVTFSRLVGGPTWLTVSANGTLGGTPWAVNVGENNFTVRIAESLNPTVYKEKTLRIPVSMKRVFVTDFDSCALKFDASSGDLNVCTQPGTWSSTPVAGMDIRKTRRNAGLLLDAVSGGFSPLVVPQDPVDVSGATVQFRTYLRRCGGGTTNNITITGLDSADKKSFQLVLSASLSAGSKLRLAYVNPTSGLTMLGPVDADNQINCNSSDVFDATVLRKVKLTMTATGYKVTLDTDTGPWVSAELPFNTTGAAPTKIAKVKISGSGTAGVWFDQIVIQGKTN